MADNKSADIKMSTASKTRKSLSKLQKMKDEGEKMAGGEEALLKEAGTAGRLATSEEMAWPIVFLGSPVASFVSGVEFNVDSADTMMKKLKLKRDVEAIPITNKLVIKAAGMAMKKQGRAE